MVCVVRSRCSSSQTNPRSVLEQQADGAQLPRQHSPPAASRADTPGMQAALSRSSSSRQAGYSRLLCLRGVLIGTFFLCHGGVVILCRLWLQALPVRSGLVPASAAAARQGGGSDPFKTLRRVVVQSGRVARPGGKGQREEWAVKFEGYDSREKVEVSATSPCLPVLLWGLLSCVSCGFSHSRSGAVASPLGSCP
jgi:hypothetical protein